MAKIKRKSVSVASSSSVKISYKWRHDKGDANILWRWRSRARYHARAHARSIAGWRRGGRQCGHHRQARASAHQARISCGGKTHRIIARHQRGKNIGMDLKLAAWQPNGGILIR